MHFCTAFVAISGDAQQVATRGTFDPISWPEIEILRQLHGDDAVGNVRPFVRVEQSVKDERERLRLIYGDEITERCYPGRNPRMELETVDVQLPVPTPSWRDPITQLIHLNEEPIPLEALPPAMTEAPKPKARKEAAF